MCFCTYHILILLSILTSLITTVVEFRSATLAEKGAATCTWLSVLLLSVFIFEERIRCLVSDRDYIKAQLLGEAALTELRAAGVEPTLYPLGIHTGCGMLGLWEV